MVRRVVMEMSKYTTEVRFICESKSGLSESKGCDNVDEVLEKSWNKIFTTSCTFFDETYRSVLCKKILKHYYLREIGSETVGVWKLWMNTKLEEIMPYYNQLYKSALLEFDPLKDYSVERTHKRTGIDGKTSSTDVSENSSGSSSNNVTDRELYSDTPQGGLDGLESESYLTSARKNTSESSSNSSVTSKGITDYTESVNSTEDYTEKVAGKVGGSSYSKMLNEFRGTMLNIDMKVINEFEELFFGLW